MYSSSKRILDILKLFSQSYSHKGYTSKEILYIISQNQKVSLKTIKNDLKKLKDYGFIVYDPITKRNKLNKSLFKFGDDKNV